MSVKLEVRTFNRFGAINVYAQKFRRHVTLATPPFEKNLRCHVRTVPETCLSNWKSVPLTVLELLTFNAQKFRGHVTLATLPFKKCPDCPWKHAYQI